jgi:hypothetical protein
MAVALLSTGAATLDVGAAPSRIEADAARRVDDRLPGDLELVDRLRGLLDSGRLEIVIGDGTTVGRLERCEGELETTRVAIRHS